MHKFDDQICKSRAMNILSCKMDVNIEQESHEVAPKNGSLPNEQGNPYTLETATCSESTQIEKPKGKMQFGPCRPFLGIILAILSALSVVLMNLFAKLCNVLPPLEIGIIRFALQLALTIPPAVYSNTEMVYSPKTTALLVLRGVSGTCGMLTRFYAVQNMPLGDATVLMFTSPIFVAILARIFLKERLH